MEEINILDFFKYLLSKLPLIIIVVLVSVFTGILYVSVIQTPVYDSSTTILLTKTEDSSTGITQNDVILNQKLVTTYSEIIKSRTIVKSVINSLSLDYSVAELTDRINVSSVSDTEIIKITVTNEKPEIARDIANTLATTFSQKIVELYNIENIGIIDKAELSNNPSNVNIVKQLILYFIIGLFISLLIVFILFYFDTSIKSAEQIEEKLGLVVLGQVPIHTDKKGK